MPAAAVRAQLGLTAQAPVFGAVGRLVPVKGLPYLLQAVPGIREKLPDSVLLLVGEGTERPGLERLARELGIASAVRFLGFRRDVLDVVNAMDVFVMPSLSEGLPMALLEALALGKTVVASTVGEIPRVCEGKPAWLVPPGDVAGLTEACLQALSSVREGVPVEPERTRAEIEALAGRMWRDTHALYRRLQGGRRELEWKSCS